MGRSARGRWSQPVCRRTQSIFLLATDSECEIASHRRCWLLLPAGYWLLLAFGWNKERKMDGHRDIATFHIQCRNNRNIVQPTKSNTRFPIPIHCQSATTPPMDDGQGDTVAGGQDVDVLEDEGRKDPDAEQAERKRETRARSRSPLAARRSPLSAPRSLSLLPLRRLEQLTNSHNKHQATSKN